MTHSMSALSCLAVLLTLASGCAAHRATEKPAEPSGYVFPECTNDEKTSRMAGRAIINCLLTEKGEVKDCVVKQPLPPMTERIVEALLQSTFPPVMFQGRPVAVRYTFTTTVDCGKKSEAPAEPAANP